LLNHSIHSRVANSTASSDRHGPRLRITPVLYRPLMLSAKALSSLSPTLPTEGSIPASARRSDGLLDEAKGITHPVMLHIGQDDHFVDKAATRSRNRGQRPGIGARRVAAAATLADKRSSDFFGKYIG